MSTFYTADLHFGHANIIKYCNRPWATTDEMDAALVERWNSVVGPEDVVRVLGDVSLSPTKLGPVSALNGILELYAGNHDKCWSGNKGFGKYITQYHDAGFFFISTKGIEYDHELANGRKVTLSHLPYEGNEHDGRKFEGYRPKDRGQVNVCGHVHDAWKVQGRSVNVGVDVWDWYPVSEDVLIDTINREVLK
jgi:calcineurin-like phosphoesterase family protein